VKRTGEPGAGEPPARFDVAGAGDGFTAGFVRHSQFTAVKEFALNNSDYRSHEEQIEAILRYLDWRNRRRGISLADWVEYKRQQAIPA